VFIRPLHETPFKDEYFDFILSTEVFEHVPVADVDRSMKEMYRVAKPGAKVRTLQYSPFARNGEPLAWQTASDTDVTILSWPRHMLPQLLGLPHGRYRMLSAPQG
jgi:ubiquinone/menaquinone biosynthesis C-methylase UbiE